MAPTWKQNGASTGISSPITGTGNLILRNLSTTPLKVTLVQKFATSSNITTPSSLLTSISGNSRLTSWRPLGRQKQKNDAATPKANPPIASQTLDVDILPFATVQTEIATLDLDSRCQLRLTFSTNNQAYTLALPSSSSSSSTSSTTTISLTSTDPAPKHNFSAICHNLTNDQQHITLLPTARFAEWMRPLPDDLPLSQLSIPGTHNSPTYHRALPSVRCQCVSITAQLEHGIRFLDVRVQVGSSSSSDDEGDPEIAEKELNTDELTLVHGAFPVALTGAKTFRSVLERVREFLAAHASETIVMSVKREGTGSGTDQRLSRILAAMTSATDGPRWYTEGRIPVLSEVRGKIVLVRRFGLDAGATTTCGERGFGIDGSQWVDNAVGDEVLKGQLCVQDFYDVKEKNMIVKKGSYCEAHLERAAVPGVDLEKRPLFVNFLSASNLWRTGCWPENIAAKLNPRIVQHLCCTHAVTGSGLGSGDEATDRISGDCTGIVVCDWIGKEDDWDLAGCIIAMNGMLQLTGR